MEYSSFLTPNYSDLTAQAIKNAIRSGDVDFFESRFFLETFLPLTEIKYIIDVEKCKAAAAKVRKEKDIKEIKKFLRKAKKTEAKLQDFKQFHDVKFLTHNERMAFTAIKTALNSQRERTGVLLKKYGLTAEEVQ